MDKKLTFLKLVNARKKAQQMKKAYGYTPEVFKFTHPKTGKLKYIVVKPKGLKRV